MRFLRTLRKLLFGETWLLPTRLALVMVGCSLLRGLASDAWHDLGGFVLLAGVASVLSLSVAAAARQRR